MNRLTCRWTAALLVVLLFGLAVSSQVWAGQYITLLHFNDLHGHLEAFIQEDNSVGGIARVAAVVHQVEAWNDNPMPARAS